MPISSQDRAALVALAHAGVAVEVTGSAPPVMKGLSGVLAELRGCFVTLTNAGRLRGCIGTFQPRRPLAQEVLEMGMAAATDGRFVNDPITAAELPSLTIEVSVLSPLEETAQPGSLQVGKHGIYIMRGGRSGCFLPEVATDMGWTREQFLDECCRGKAGLPPDAWRQPGTRVYLFTSEKFS